MGNKTTSLRSTFSVGNEIISDDTRFLNVVIDIMHVGKNLNNSYFDKDVVNSCIDSIKNTPVLGFIRCDNYTGENDFEGHEYIVKRTENGIEEIYIGKAYGVIPESCNPRWVIKVCDDGMEREFLRVDALIWEKFSDATSIIRRDGEKPESMELEVSSIEGYDDEDGVFHFTSFRFDGACLLGDSVSPAMIGANVRINDGVNFTMSDIRDSVRSELNDKFELFNVTFAALVSDKSNQGGVDNMPNTDLEQIIEDQPAEFEQEVVEDEVVEIEESECETVEIEEAVEDEVEEEVESEFTDTESEVVDIEAEYAKMKADFDEAITALNQLKSDYDAIKADFDEMKPKYDEYVKAEEQREIEEQNAQKEAKFAEYEDVLGENDDFIALKEKKDEMSVDEIEKECAVMFVKVSRSSKINFSKASSTSAVVGVFEDGGDADDGYIHTKYGSIRRVR